LATPDPDLAADMYLWASEALAAHGYEQYEISNWALSKDEGGRMKDEEEPNAAGFILHPSSFIPYFACRHNLQYWRNRPYLGFGAGAHGCAAGWRYSNVLAPGAYIGRVENAAEGAGQPGRPFPFSAATVETTQVTSETAM